MATLTNASRRFIDSGAQLLIVNDCWLSPDNLFSFNCRGRRRKRFPAVGRAVTDWQRKGGPGEWGIRLVGWGRGVEVNGIFVVDGVDWENLKMVEAVAYDGCVRRSNGEGGGEKWVEGGDVVSVRIRDEMGWGKGPGMWKEVNVLARKVDEAVWKLSCRTTRVIWFGKAGGDEYMRGISDADCEVVASAQHVDLVAAWELCSRLLACSKRLLIVIDPNDGPRPAQLGAPFLDYERLGCGWSPDSKALLPVVCPVHLSAIACGFFEEGQGVLQTPITRLSALPPPQGCRVFFMELSPPYATSAKLLETLVAWAPEATIVKTPTRDAQNALPGDTSNDVCCVFIGVRRSNHRFALYRLRAIFAKIVVVWTTAPSTQIKGSYWDGTFY